MTCDEFERALQQRADGLSDADDAVLRKHGQSCSACHELEEGFRLFTQAFAVNRPPQAAPDLTERVMAALESEPASRPRWRIAAVALAVAASLLLTLGWWMKSTEPESEPGSTDSKIAEHLPSSSDLLFPELTDSLADTRDGVALVEAVEPVSQIFLAVGRSLGSPVRPIAVSASEAIGNLIRDIPDPDSTMMPVPGMREMMPAPMKKKMDDKGRSS